MNLKELRDKEYIKCVNLLSKLISLDDSTKEKIYKYFKTMGIKNFFLHLESIDLPLEVYEKLQSVKTIIEVFDDEGGQA